jgi:predicted MFS family arabinose efflux permease
MAVHGGGTLALLIIGALVLDFGIQGAHTINLAAIYRLSPQIRSRVTTVYLTSNFLGGVAGTAASGAAYAAHGWGAVCIVGAAFLGAALVLWIVEALTARSR